MPIIFGDPPYDTLIAISASSKQTQDGVELTLQIEVPGRDDAIPLLFLLDPETAGGLGSALHIDAGVVRRWWNNQR
jgi:hypothetical protein